MPERVMMIRHTLADVPIMPLPKPFTLRWYADGDAEQWMAIKSASDKHHHAPGDFFTETYGAYLDILAQSQLFLCDGTGRPVGTITAWFEDLSGTRYGKVNWMLILPEAQGLGLAKPLLAACLTRLAELGHTTAVLYTLTARMPAINLYRGFGFVPLIRTPTDTEAWQSASPHMKRPFTPREHFALSV